jgi:hypothetical protein
VRDTEPLMMALFVALLVMVVVAAVGLYLAGVD